MYYFEVIDALRVDCRAYSTHNRPTYCASASHPRDPLQGSPIWSQQGLHTSKSQGAIQHRRLEVEDPSCALCILGYCNFRFVIFVIRIDYNCIELIFDITFTIAQRVCIGEVISRPNCIRDILGPENINRMWLGEVCSGCFLPFMPQFAHFRNHIQVIFSDPALTDWQIKIGKDLFC